MPQGCIINPILWPTYIAPLSKLLRRGEHDQVTLQSFQLADDITLSISSHDVIKLNLETAKELAVGAEFCRILYIRLNLTKCNVLTVSMNPESAKQMSSS